MVNNGLSRRAADLRHHQWLGGVPEVKKNQLGKKRYELTNWLGNVNVVVSDRKQTTQASYIDETNAFESAGNVEGWLVVSPAVRTATGGELRVTTSTTNNYTYKNFTTVVGEEYTVTVNATQGTSPGLELVVPGSTQTITSGVTKYITFTATSTSSQVRVKSTGTTGSTNFYVQDIRIRTQARYDAVTLMKADYYPFGMTIPGRSTNTADYRYAYNGMEQDVELKGNGNSYTTEFRQYDPRIGRWMSLDPLMMMFPDLSPYCGFDNNPIFYTDPYGLSATNKDGNPLPDGLPAQKNG